jgi:TerC family integral membrane protein
MHDSGSMGAAAWAAFAAFVAAAVALDLGVLGRRARPIGFREALARTGAWAALAVGFGGLLAALRGRAAALEFFAGYVVEQALSVDNVFVMLAIFSALAVPQLLRHRVLFWGVLGAVVMRGALIAGGASLLGRFHWLTYVLGGALVYAAVKLGAGGEGEGGVGGGGAAALFRRLLPTTEGFRGARFVVREGGRLYATPLLAALVAVELADLAFAADSVPAVFAVTRDPFLAFSSNVFAILGLRSLYFALDGAAAKLHYLRHGLAAVLLFVGGKMLLAGVVDVPVGPSLAFVALAVTTAVVASIVRDRRLARAAAAASARPAPVRE